MTRTKTPPAKPAAPAAAPVGQPGQVDPPARTRLQIDVTPDVLELLEVVSGVTGQPKTGLILEALMLALPGFVGVRNLLSWLVGRFKPSRPGNLGHNDLTV